MFEKLDTQDEFFSYKLGAALTIEGDFLQLLDELEQKTCRDELSRLFQSGAEEARQHIRNLAASFRLLGEKPDETPCPVVRALEEDVGAALAKADRGMADAVIVAGAAEAAHYKIAVYETLVIEAEVRDASRVLALLGANLEQERAALGALNGAAKRISEEAHARSGATGSLRALEP